jgi:hypothetical protein
MYIDIRSSHEQVTFSPFNENILRCFELVDKILCNKNGCLDEVTAIYHILE